MLSGKAALQVQSSLYPLTSVEYKHKKNLKCEAFINTLYSHVHVKRCQVIM